MSESEPKNKCECNCGCGCFGCLTMVVSIVLICFIFGCEWSRNCVTRCIKDVTSAVSEGKEGK